MNFWFSFWLFLHILAAIIAFGPTFAFPLIGPMIGKEPMHGNFGLRIMEILEDRLVIPFALSMPVSGVGIIVAGPIYLGQPWLLIGITLYLVAITFSLTVLRPATVKLIHMTEHPPAMAAGPGAAPAGPPPEMQKLVRRTQVGGMFTTALFLLIMIMMVFRPGSGFHVF